jgi:hypothetical protein
MSQVLIEVSKQEKTFDPKGIANKVLNIIDLTINEGEMTAI